MQRETSGANAGGLVDWATPAEPAPGPEGLVTPLLGAAVLAAVVWRVSLRLFRRRDDHLDLDDPEE